MEQYMMMAMQTAQEYAQKSAIHTLTEYEALMYEQVCNLVAAHAKLHDLVMQANILEVEENLIKKRQDHARWLRDHDCESC